MRHVALGFLNIEARVLERTDWWLARMLEGREDCRGEEQ